MKLPGAENVSATAQEPVNTYIASRCEDNRQAWSGLRKVAWLRSGALGDLVVGLASLVELPRFFPEGRVTVIGPSLWLQLLDARVMPFLERLIVVPRKGKRGRAYHARDGAWVAESETDEDLAKLLGGYEAFVNTNTDSYRYGFVAMRARVPVRIGSAPREMAWLYHYNAPFLGKDPLIHERDLPLALLEFATPGWRRFTRATPANRAQLAEILGASRLIAGWHERGLPNLIQYSDERVRALTGLERGRYFLVNPTSSRREKAWPSEKARELLLGMRAELNQLNLEPLVIGAPTETEWLREVAGGEFRVVQPVSLRDLQEVVRGARLLLTNVSSMQFIAASTQTPTLTVVGRSKPEIWGPVGCRDRIVRAKPLDATEGGSLSIFEEEALMYRSVTVDEVKQAFLPMIREISALHQPH